MLSVHKNVTAMTEEDAEFAEIRRQARARVLDFMSAISRGEITGTPAIPPEDTECDARDRLNAMSG